MSANIGTVASPDRYPFANGIVMAYPENQTLAGLGVTDIYFRGYDTSYPDNWRVDEWMREFNGTTQGGSPTNNYVANGNLPSLTLMRLGRDHMGGFGNNVLATAARRKPSRRTTTMPSDV